MWVAARRPGQLRRSKTGLVSSVCKGYIGKLETFRKNYSSYFSQRQDEDLNITSQIENYLINFEASIVLLLSFPIFSFRKEIPCVVCAERKNWYLDEANKLQEKLRIHLNELSRRYSSSETLCDIARSWIRLASVAWKTLARKSSQFDKACKTL
jgi:hypothetical protein